MLGEEDCEALERAHAIPSRRRKCLKPERIREPPPHVDRVVLLEDVRTRCLPATKGERAYPCVCRSPTSANDELYFAPTMRYATLWADDTMDRRYERISLKEI